MSVARQREALRVFGPVTTQSYGQTECHTIVTALLPRDHHRGDFGQTGDHGFVDHQGAASASRHAAGAAEALRSIVIAAEFR
jgi:hypothetical protein